MVITALALLFLSSASSALPTGDGAVQPISLPPRRCGTVASYYGQTTKDWDKYKMDQWLEAWMKNHSSEISHHSYGFSGAFGDWAMGNPDWSCRDDGSASSCDLDLCDNKRLNSRGDDIRSTYYTLEAVNRLHSYFTGLSEAFEVSAIASALSKDKWSKTFYKPKNNDKTINTLKAVLTAITTTIGIGATFAGLGEGTALLGTAGSVFSNIASGASVEGQLQLKQDKDDTFDKDAQLGAILAQVVVQSMKSFTAANNDLMAGKSYKNTGDIKKYLSGGAFVAFQGVDKNKVIDKMNAFILASAVNQLWRQQKIFILGGGKCGDGQGIGSGPKDYSVCRDGKAWYIYYWHEGNGDPFSGKQWGYVTKPPGADELGKGDYAGIKIADVINSSLDSYNVGEYNYDSNKAAERVQLALKKGWRNPGAQGPSWEGTFTIPVCDVSGAVGKGYYDGRYILEDYGKNSRPVWCGPICSDDWDKTDRFISAAHMNNFKSPKHICQDHGIRIHY
ncbi:hypothetical protein F5B20DRAFT_194404 [Whalleya microplaca]|nr:hypothetical protein F5B20DRAFT_194404 [Whalleya microplaca]